MDYANLGILLITTAGCTFFVVMSAKKKLKPFLPKYLGKIITQNTPIYYDLEGKVIDKDKKVTISQPIYNLQADTSAIITPNIVPVIKEEIKPEVIQDVIIVKDKVYSVYCMKCKSKKEINNVELKKYETAKGVKFFAKGTCVTCGNTKCCGFVKG